MSSSTKYLSHIVEKISPGWTDRELLRLLRKKTMSNIALTTSTLSKGEVVVENVTDSVYQSRKVLAVWSGSYTSSKYPREVLPRILDRGVSRGFLNPRPIQGLRKRKLIPILRPKPQK